MTPPPKRAEILEDNNKRKEREKYKEKSEKQEKELTDNNKKVELIPYYIPKDLLKEVRKDMSLTKKPIHPYRERVVGYSRGVNELLGMEYQVMQTLTSATLQRVGSFEKAIFQMNKGLLHVLHLIDVAPESKISTRELLRSINSTSMHKYLKEAEELGFIRRYTERMPQGQKGGVMVTNSLTEEGRVLLKLHDELASSSVRESRQHR